MSVQWYSHPWGIGLLVAVCLAGSGPGCSSPKAEEGPSYAELVETYNAELALLDRLEGKKKEMIEQYEQQHRPSGDALSTLSQLIDTVAQDDAGKKLPTDPNELLDQQVANLEQAQQAMSKLKQSLGDRSEKQPVEYSEEFKQQLVDIDQQIEEQQARVDRARAARDAAEEKAAQK